MIILICVWISRSLRRNPGLPVASEQSLVASGQPLVASEQSLVASEQSPVASERIGCSPDRVGTESSRGRPDGWANGPERYSLRGLDGW